MTAEAEPLIVMVAPTGARRGKADHPALPVAPGELARTAADCREAGACMIHLHVRDRDGAHTLEAEAYRTAIAAIEKAVGEGLVIQVSSEAAGRFGPEQQMAMVRELRPEAVSLGLNEIVPDPQWEAAAADFLAWLRAQRILPQYILYSPRDVARYNDLCARGVIPGERHFLLFVLGEYGSRREARAPELLPCLQALERPADWAVCAFGRRESACVMAAAALGGHGRVGFENNLYLSDGARAPDNAALIAQFGAGARLLGRPLADAATARSLLWQWGE